MLQIGGVPNAELNTLELEFLFLTNFELQVRRDVYDRYRECLLTWDKEQVNYMGIGDGFGAACRGAHYGMGNAVQSNGATGDADAVPDCVEMDTGDAEAEDGSDNSKAATEAFATPPPHDGDGDGDAREDMVID